MYADEKAKKAKKLAGGDEDDKKDKKEKKEKKKKSMVNFIIKAMVQNINMESMDLQLDLLSELLLHVFNHLHKL